VIGSFAEGGEVPLTDLARVQQKATWFESDLSEPKLLWIKTGFPDLLATEFLWRFTLTITDIYS